MFLFSSGGGSLLSKILIVETTGFLCRLLAKSITEKGYAAMVAKDPLQAIKGAKGAALILLDMEMRAKLSKEVICQKILDVAPKTCIYLVTSRIEGIESKVKKCSAKGFFRKPLSPKEFATFLDGFLSKKEPKKILHKESKKVLEKEIKEADSHGKSEHICHVLVVQDKGELCNELIGAAEGKMIFDSARTIDEAIERLQSTRPCLLLFDMDWSSEPAALEACRMLSQWDMQPIPTVLILSSFEEADSIAETLGAEAYHLKPVDGLFVYSWLEQGPKFLLQAHKESRKSSRKLKEVPPITPAGCRE